MSCIGKVRKEIGANDRTFPKKAGLSQETLDQTEDLHPVYSSEVKRGERPETSENGGFGA